MINLITVCIIYVIVLCNQLFEQYSLNIYLGSESATNVNYC